MRCTVCGQESDQPSKFCPNCGAPMPEQESQQAEPAQPVQPTQQAYVRPDYDPAQQAQPTAPPQYGAQPAVQRPSSTGQIVFAVINIVLGCVSWCGSTIFGIIALIFAILANSAPTYQEAESKLRTAKILNIIGVAIAVVLFIIILVAGIAMIPFYDSYY